MTVGGWELQGALHHLFRCLDERTFTFNERQRSDFSRFVLVLFQAVGRRVTWDELTGKSMQATTTEN